MSREHKKPAPKSGFQRLPSPLPLPPFVIDHAWYGLSSGWKAVVVCSSLEDHGGGKLMHHISVRMNLEGETMKTGTYPADVQHAVEAFGMQNATEDNRHGSGYAHHFWLPVEARKVN